MFFSQKDGGFKMEKVSVSGIGNMRESDIVKLPLTGAFKGIPKSVEVVDLMVKRGYDNEAKAYTDEIKGAILKVADIEYLDAIKTLSLTNTDMAQTMLDSMPVYEVNVESEDLAVMFAEHEKVMTEDKVIKLTECIIDVFIQRGDKVVYEKGDKSTTFGIKGLKLVLTEAGNVEIASPFTLDD